MALLKCEVRNSEAGEMTMEIDHSIAIEPEGRSRQVKKTGIISSAILLKRNVFHWTFL